MRCLSGWVLDKAEFEPCILRARERVVHLESETANERKRQASEQDLQQVLGQLEGFARWVGTRLENSDWPTWREIIRTMVKRIEIDATEARVI